MTGHFQRAKKTVTYRVLSTFVAFTFSFSYIVPPSSLYAQGVPTTFMNLPVPGTPVPLTPGFTPARIIGMTIHADNPLMFDFMVDPGDMTLNDQQMQDESLKLVKYFLASLTVPAEKLWVNLSPYEKDKIVPKEFGQTEMGAELLAQDYMLKQLTASLMNPEDELGKKFWDRVYAKAQKMFGTAEIPLNTFNKVWIVPEKAVVYANGLNVFVLESRFKVMMEEDYLALQHHSAENSKGKSEDIISGVSSAVIKEVLLPEIEKEVNEGKTFANLRQIHNSLILATWYKQNLKESLLGKIYSDKGKTGGLTVADKETSQKIYDQYVEAFQKGVHNFIKEDYDPATKQTIPRKYFSGGVTEAKLEIEGRTSPEPEVLQAFAKDLPNVSIVTAGAESLDKKVTFKMPFTPPAKPASSPIAVTSYSYTDKQGNKVTMGYSPDRKGITPMGGVASVVFITPDNQRTERWVSGNPIPKAMSEVMGFSQQTSKNHVVHKWLMAALEAENMVDVPTPYYLSNIERAEREYVIAGNYKMSEKTLTQAQVKELVRQTVKNIYQKLPQDANPQDLDIVIPIGVSHVHLAAAQNAIKELEAEGVPSGIIQLAVQDISAYEPGARTGEVAVEQLADFNVKYVILGHSERRRDPLINESSQFVNAKAKRVLAQGLTPIIALGENLQEREEGRTFEIIASQLLESTAGFSEGQMSKIVIAYEPVWAIGTGKVATPEQANEIHRLLRALVFDRYDSGVAKKIRIIYGGSVKAGNIGGLIQEYNIDGALVGGDSLNASAFSDIAIESLKHFRSASSPVLSAEIQAQLRETAAKMVPLTGGILAADESTGSAKARLDLVGLENTPENREKMRQLMLTTPGLAAAGINAVILYSETFDNTDGRGGNLTQYLLSQGILPGIKTDGGLIDDPESAGEKIPDPKGLAKLQEMLTKFKAKGAVFTKWRTTQAIDSVKGLPTDGNIRKNAVVQAQEAKMTQESGLVPIVEPEVLLDGTHDILASYKATTRTLEITFEELAWERVWLPGMILKTSMILSGNKAEIRADAEEVGYQTLKGLLKVVPAAVPAIVFLSGGQKDDEVVKNLDAVIRASQTRFEAARNEAAAELRAEGKTQQAQEVQGLAKAPWEISYSFGRGLQRPALLAWAGKDENFAAAQEVMKKTSLSTQAARLGKLESASSPIAGLSAKENQQLRTVLRRFPNLVATKTAEKLTQLGLRGAYKHVADILGREISNEQKLQDLKYLFADLYQKTEARAIEDLEIMVTQKQANEAITKEELSKIKQVIKDTSDGFAKRIYVETAKELGVIMMVRVSEGFGRDEVAESLKSNEVVVPDDLRGEIDRVIIAIQDGEKFYRSTSGKIYGIVNAIIDVIEGTDMFVTNSDDKTLEKIEDFESGSTSVIVTGDGVADLGNSPDGYVGQFLTNLDEHAEEFKQKTVEVNGQTYSLRDPELYMAYPEKLEEYFKFLAQIRGQRLEDIQEEIVLMNRPRETDMIQAIQKLQQRIPGLKVVGKDQKGIKDGTVAHGLKAVMTPQMFEAFTGKGYGVHKTVLTVGGAAEGFMNLAIAGGFRAQGAVGGLRVLSGQMNKDAQGVEMKDKSQRYNFRVDPKKPEGNEPQNIRNLRKSYGDAEEILAGKKVFFEDNVKGEVAGAFSFISTNGVFSKAGVAPSEDGGDGAAINVLRIEAQLGQKPVLAIVSNKILANGVPSLHVLASDLASSPVSREEIGGLRKDFLAKTEVFKRVPLESEEGRESLTANIEAIQKEITVIQENGNLQATPELLTFPGWITGLRDVIIPNTRKMTQVQSRIPQGIIPELNSFLETSYRLLDAVMQFEEGKMTTFAIEGDRGYSIFYENGKAVVQAFKPHDVLGTGPVLFSKEIGERESASKILFVIAEALDTAKINSKSSQRYIRSIAEAAAEKAVAAPSPVDAAGAASLAAEGREREAFEIVKSIISKLPTINVRADEITLDAKLDENLGIDSEILSLDGVNPFTKLEIFKERLGENFAVTIPDNFFKPGATVFGLVKLVTASPPVTREQVQARVLRVIGGVLHSSDNREIMTMDLEYDDEVETGDFISILNRLEAEFKVSLSEMTNFEVSEVVGYIYKKLILADAQISSSPLAVEKPKETGGIDLNPGNMDMQTNYGGEKIHLPMPNIPLESIKIDGLVPIIIHVAPVVNLPFLLGLADVPVTDDAAEFQPQQSPVDAPRRFKAREAEEIGMLN